MTAFPRLRPRDVERPRVLCVDDNRDLADSYEMLLDACGYDAMACYDGVTAVRLAATFRPHACVLDLSLPGMDGDEIARRIVSLNDLPAPYLICVTAQTDERARRRCRDAGFHAILKKPVEPADLLRHLPKATIRAALPGPRAEGRDVDGGPASHLPDKLPHSPVPTIPSGDES